MRIIGGEMRSRTLLAPKGMDTRPTLDRTRESLFNILMGQCEGARVLDLYAGSGALGLEAISRGARSAVLCDCSREAAKAIAANIQALRVGERVQLLHMRDMQAIAAMQGAGERFDLVFLDPPYRMRTEEACKALGDAGLLAADALVVIEHAALTPPAPDARFVLEKQRQYRETMVSFYHYNERYKETNDGGNMDFSGQL